MAKLTRLTDSTLGASGALDYRLEGAHDRRGRPLLNLTVKGKVQLQCQRCLEAFAHVIDIGTSLRLVAPEALEQEYDDDPDEPDCIAHNKSLDLAALIEDEVLLALPSYPRHTEGQCTTRTTSVTDTGRVAATEARVLAFDALRALKRH